MELTADQKQERVQSTRTYKKVLEDARAHGLSPHKAVSAAHDASRAALDRKVPDWERGNEGFLGLGVRRA